MPKQELHIIFHNPNNEKDSEKIAEFFISRVSTKVFTEAIKNLVNNADKSMSSKQTGTRN